MNNEDRLLKHIQTSDGLGFDQNEVLQSIINRNEKDIDTSKCADALLKKFGSFTAVVNADLTELISVGKISEITARSIKAVAVYSRMYMNSVFSNNMRVFNTESAYMMMKDNFFSRNHEYIGLMILDRKGYVVYNDIIAQCDVRTVPSYIKRVISLCLKYDGDSVILAHNHTSGVTIPTREDIVATREVQLALHGIYVTLFDHLIIADGDYSSMRKAGIIKSITEEVNSFKENLYYRGLVLDSGHQVEDFGKKVRTDESENYEYYDYEDEDGEE